MDPNNDTRPELMKLAERARRMLEQECHTKLSNPLQTPLSLKVGRIICMSMREPAASQRHLEQAIEGFIRGARKR